MRFPYFTILKTRYRNPLEGLLLECAALVHAQVVILARKCGAGRYLKDPVSGTVPDYARPSLSWSVFLHILVILILPLILQMGSCQMRYGIPEGGAETTVQVQVQEQKVVEDRLVFNMNSAISYFVPELDESEVLEKVDEETRQTYQAGQIGSGSGNTGGYAGGMSDAKVRFIRLKYDGGDWNQQMGKGADYNFLLQVNKLAGFKVARNTEAINIADLNHFPKHGAPPFVYLTGSGGIRVSSRDAKTLRKYLLEEGGLLFADNGGGNFNGSFRNLLRQVLPEKSLVEIPLDDILFREPFVFSNGAPPLWHHSGTRALGVKHEGRWVAFYHQGDINDAWQDGGSGASEALRNQAFRMGVNVVHYSFRQYLSRHVSGAQP